MEIETVFKMVFIASLVATHPATGVLSQIIQHVYLKTHHVSV